MKKSLKTFLQFVVVLVGICVLALMLWEPHLEGRNVGATVFEIYFNDPFLAYAYASSIAFFLGLYQIFKLLGFAGEDKLHSSPAAISLRTIKRCAMTLVALVAGAEIYIIATMRGKDDIAGGVAMGLFMITGSLLVALAARMLERRLQNALDAKS